MVPWKIFPKCKLLFKSRDPEDRKTAVQLKLRTRAESQSVTVKSVINVVNNVHVE